MYNYGAIQYAFSSLHYTCINMDLLSLQVVPAYSAGHTQVKKRWLAMQLPPFLHVPEVH